MEYQAALSWDQVKRFKDDHDVPLILKGIATGEDAAMACDHGVEGVYVSNHGGRQLDHGRGSWRCCRRWSRRWPGAAVFVDGGFLRGTDVVKAIAGGAHCVGLGRLACFGLAAAGAPGSSAPSSSSRKRSASASGSSASTRLAELDSILPPRREPGGAAPRDQRLPLLEEGY